MVPCDGFQKLRAVSHLCGLYSGDLCSRAPFQDHCILTAHRFLANSLYQVLWPPSSQYLSPPQPS